MELIVIAMLVLELRVAEEMEVMVLGLEEAPQPEIMEEQAHLEALVVEVAVLEVLAVRMALVAPAGSGQSTKSTMRQEAVGDIAFLILNMEKAVPV